ncbi:MAG TPA: class IV adenylate cyclase [Terriglobales bacterium]|nr:class IV adenylate cyclase [Terriglobales bacterium]
MPGAHEIEIKFKVSDIEDLSQRLRKLGMQQLTPRTHEMNVLFDLPGHPLRNRGELLRLRKYGEKWVLTHKAKSKDSGGRHKKRIETETRVENGETMEGILRALHFEPCFRYEKFRAEWKGERGHVVIDETPIGNFAEIEGPPEWIDSIAHNLGVEPRDYITENYSALFSNWKTKTGNRAEEMTFAAVGGSLS